MAYHYYRPIACIIPPYMLEAIVQNGTPHQRTIALRTLQSDHTFRTVRLTHHHMKSSAPALQPAQPGQPQRTVYTAHNTTKLPGDTLLNEGSSEIRDAAANEAYAGLGYTYQFYWDIYRRNSIDSKGLPLKAVVHYDKNYNNAFWDGTYMVFGDGDGDLFNRFTLAVDVIGHELTHGVTGDEVGLWYIYQPGALNESVSDVFGSMVKQYTLKQKVDEADWLIGAGLFTAKVNGVAFRSMKAPGTAYDDPVLGKDPQPAHMRDFVYTMQDNGGVHLNSGIPNHAFYLLATRLGGHSWEKAGRIWYNTIRDTQLEPNASFQAFATRTLANADQLYGTGGKEHNAVKDAWNSVGISI